MNNIQSSRPNELIYINLGSMEPFVKDLDIPKTQLKQEKKKLLAESNSSILPEVVFNRATGKYLVVGGYTTYYAYLDIINSNKLIPCKAFYHLAEDERYLLTLDWVLKNKVDNWYNRHDIITKLKVDFNYTKEELGTFLSKKTSYFNFYLDPPSNIKNITINQKRESTINKINREAFKHSHNKDYLYILVLHYGVPITDEQLKFIRWLRGNGIRFESCNLTLEQEHQLIDKALHLKEDFLNDIRMIIEAW